MEASDTHASNPRLGVKAKAKHYYLSHFQQKNTKTPIKSAFFDIFGHCYIYFSSIGNRAIANIPTVLQRLQSLLQNVCIQTLDII